MKKARLSRPIFAKFRDSCAREILLNCSLKIWMSEEGTVEFLLQGRKLKTILFAIGKLLSEVLKYQLPDPITLRRLRDRK